MVSHPPVASVVERVILVALSLSLFFPLVYLFAVRECVAGWAGMRVAAARRGLLRRLASSSRSATIRHPLSACLFAPSSPPPHLIDRMSRWGVLVRS